ncbi:MAG: ribosome small subunit-dependent GTPase A [Eubacteriales bacterium]|nr:ribosome small subunit-dependent GTPase A [Eubacteriales bacterium]
MNKGKILKGIGGFYYVLDEHGCVHECKARGRFRNDGIVPLPGDNVLFNLEKGTGGFIEEIEERKNVLIRPKVVNVDMVAIVVSAENPKIDFLLCDKLLISIKKAGITPLMVINKCDMAVDRHIDTVYNEYATACETIRVSAKSKDGLDHLKSLLGNKCTCLAGQSATGKSSILNALFSDIELETGGLSKKTDRGRHTTRHAELMVLEGFSGTVVDTPGFSFFEDTEILPEQLSLFYDDMTPYAGDCRFSLCLHADEPDCGVKKAVEKGKISKNRYQRYLEILKECQEKRLRKYD